MFLVLFKMSISFRTLHFDDSSKKRPPCFCSQFKTFKETDYSVNCRNFHDSVLQQRLLMSPSPGGDSDAGAAVCSSGLQSSC